MALVQKIKWIVFNDDFTGLEFKEDRDNTIDDFDFAIPISYQEKDTNSAPRAERLPGVVLNQGRSRGVTTLS